jgi:hypothetical protein
MTSRLPQARIARDSFSKPPLSPNLSTSCPEYRGEKFNAIMALGFAEFESHLVGKWAARRRRAHYDAFSHGSDPAASGTPNYEPAHDFAGCMLFNEKIARNSRT